MNKIQNYIKKTEEEFDEKFEMDLYYYGIKGRLVGDIKSFLTASLSNLVNVVLEEVKIEKYKQNDKGEYIEFPDSESINETLAMYVWNQAIQQLEEKKKELYETRRPSL